VFEYKVSHALDKASESVTGFISVLPGAFSAYRWIALAPDSRGNGPLLTYFKSITSSLDSVGPIAANMYLAEVSVFTAHRIEPSRRVVESSTVCGSVAQ
jgi:chitin synthase